MKKPLLFDAEPVKTEAKPILIKGPYNVYVGSIDEDKLPMYVVINRDTGVVEFTHEVTAFITDWLNHFVPDNTKMPGGGEQLTLNGLNS